MVLSRAIARDLHLNNIPSRAKLRSRLQGTVLALGLLVAAGFAANTFSPMASAQTAVTGAISGAVSDGAGGMVPGAKVVVTDAGTDAKQTVVSNAEGRYSVGLLKPGTYKITATSAGLKSDTIQLTVVIGTTVTGDIKVTPTGDTQIVDVNATTVPLIDTQNVALVTTFTAEQIQALPTPGGDVTTVAFTLPGVVVNAGGEYGNFSSDGLPGISNLFVLNGFDNQDPFLNLNNSGSSNLTLGAGELEEATVVQNGYNSQYGRAAGAVIQYTTKSGSNKFHGMLDYNWNGSALNANGWFNQFYETGAGSPATRPHAVSNQWAANVGGPIIKDRVFFFADYEGLRYVLPGAAGLVNFPSPQFQAAALANVPAADKAFYAQTFSLYQGAPAYASATPIALTPLANINDANATDGGCGQPDNGGFAGTPVPGGGTFGVDTPCVTQGVGETNNINKEWLFTGRADWNISDKHKIYGRYKMDRGSQPTGTSFINPLFSVVSIQPEYEGQFNDSYVISPTKTNVVVLAANWYTAYFGPANVAASQAAYPWSAVPDAGFDASGTPSSPGLAGLGAPYYFPQGRNVTQYQIEDDFSWIHGKHTFKLGLNFRRDLVSDFDAQVLTDYPLEENFDLAAFYNGSIDFDGVYIQNFVAQKTAHLALYNLGAYFQDEFQANAKLKLTMGVRIDRTGNPLCHNGCFSKYDGSFPSASASPTQPYNAADGGSISSQNWHPFPKVEVFNFQPRFGFNYSINEKTEIRGGAGLFSDLYPSAFIDSAIQNFPNVDSQELFIGNLAPSGPGSLGANAIAANTAVEGGFAKGESVTQIGQALAAQGVPFTPPAIGAYFAGTFHVPEYLEYSMQIQHQFSKSDALILTYAGNYGYNEVLQNPLLNPSQGAYAGDGKWALNPNGNLNEFGATPPDPSFSRVTGFTNNAHSNYNGVMISYKRDGHGLTGQLSYTYSHSLDLVSNGGEGEPFNGGSVGAQVTPNLGPGNLNYSNSDYDIRNNVVGDASYIEPLKFSNKLLTEALGGWVIGAKTYWRTGEPFSIYNADLAEASYSNLGSTFLGDSAPGVKKLENLSKSHSHYCVVGSCLNTNDYVDPAAQTDFGTIRRNSLYGPHYVDTDLSLSKKIVKAEGFTMSIGANAYNAFNKANFGNPASTLGVSNFGLIQSTLAPPTSPYGSFQGAAVTQRLFQVHGKITF